VKINPELKSWFMEKVKNHIIEGVQVFKENDWYGGPVQTTDCFYKDFQYTFDHVITMQKEGTEHVSVWFEDFNCPIENRNIEEMMHLMAQVRDGDISYKMLFEEPKHPKKK
jgi:hypothetical protein